MRITSTGCCGLSLLEDISAEPNPEAVVRRVARTYPRKTHYVFSEAFYGTGSRRYGADLKTYILRNKLGTVVESVTRVNPNSGNKLIIYTWTPARGSLSKFR